MLHFISFGSGSSGNCSVLFSDRAALIIDVGVGVRTLKKGARSYGLRLPGTVAVLVTHDHVDHVKSVGSLSKDYGLPVYATQKVHAGIQRNWLVRNKIAPELAHVVEKNVAFEVGDFEVTPFDVPHDASDNVGYCIRHGGDTFVLMTDIGHFTDEIRENIGRANYLVIEADYDEEMLRAGTYSDRLKQRIAGPKGHASNTDCGLAIAQNATKNLRHVWLCHLSDNNNHPELAEKTVTQILRDHGIVAGNNAGADFRLDVLKRSTPSGVYEL